MNTVESDQIIGEYLAEQERQKQLQLMQLCNCVITSIHLPSKSSRRK